MSQLSDEILHNRPDRVLFLLQSGVDPNALDIYGFTPLIEAAIANHLDLGKLLVEYGANCKARDLTQGTALHWAVENNNVAFSRFLLEQGADPNVYNQSQQAPLVLPLLRRQQALKEALYQYGADLKFAQDYINTKLIGHRFELTGTVDIVDPNQVFIPVDLEGFILEFTLSVMQDSLLQFKNNFGARNVRTHFPELQEVIMAFVGANNLIQYQHHLVDIERHTQRLSRIAQQKVLLLPVGYEGHAITFARCGQWFAKCDRGANSQHNPSVGIYRMTRPQAFNTEFLKHLVYQKQSKRFVTETIFQMLELEEIATLPLPSQLTGNCSWANVEAAIAALLFMLRYSVNASMEEAQSTAMEIYQQWQRWDQDWALHQCVESFYEANPARKASKAALLGAVLFQTCRYTQPADLERANKILAVLATPEYRYVLDAYLKTYRGTPAGHNLMELVDLYSR
ncbi:MAG: ankyrin repeat domain-containing protein [Gammaproteobacteria bacterium]